MLRCSFETSSASGQLGKEKLIFAILDPIKLKWPYERPLLVYYNAPSPPNKTQKETEKKPLILPEFSL